MNADGRRQELKGSKAEGRIGLVLEVPVGESLAWVELNLVLLEEALRKGRDTGKIGHAVATFWLKALEASKLKAEKVKEGARDEGRGTRDPQTSTDREHGRARTPGNRAQLCGAVEDA